ncbi:hypothetical protein BKA63DRAFT_138013 [Paraphoma chrysanthemicola]|nr:hypothetical protein BKA63DRAFT_138013 [Paraphoma chrysanthemicola]
MSATANTGFRFLDLPAELRNRIYDLAATTDDPIRITREKTLHHPHRYAGLTRVCRQIRKEYLAIQRRAAHLEVDWDELPHYMTTFHADKSSNDFRPKYLDVRLTCAYEYKELHEPHVDILPLLQLKAGATDMVVRVTSIVYDEGAFVRQMNALLDEARLDLQQLIDNNNEEWVRCIRLGHFDSIMVGRETWHEGDASIDIVFALDQKESEVLKQIKQYSESGSNLDLMRRFGFGDTGYLCSGHFLVSTSSIMDNA